MKSKFIGIVIVGLLIATAVLPIIESETMTTTYIVEDNDCGCTDKLYNLRFFPLPVMMEIPELSYVDVNVSSIALIDTPEYFNWRDYEGKDWTTPARDQGMCGSCWAFAALGALESVINIREGLADLDPDISEQYILSCLPGSGSCNGGDPGMAFKLIMSNKSSGNNCNGIIPEECFPYQALDTIPCDDKWENWQEYLIPILAQGNIVVQRETMKSAIMEKGPIAAYVNANDNLHAWFYSHHSPDEYYPYEYSAGTNHVVTIVGWKDDVSIGKGGYWICKNSWGVLGGYNGFFNLEYESLGIERVTPSWVDYDPESYDWHPTPKAYGPYYGLTNQPLQFTGVTGGEHPPFTWLWEFGDGATSEEQNPVHTYLSPGNYEVILTVSDDNGNYFTATTFACIQMTNQPPQTPLIDGPDKVKVGEYCWYNVTVNDPDGGVIYIYYECFNTSSYKWVGPFPSNQVLPGYGNWTEKGTFTARVKAKDPYGAESDWATLEVRVTKDKASLSITFQRFLETHPYFFPLLQHLLDLKI